MNVFVDTKAFLVDRRLHRQENKSVAYFLLRDRKPYILDFLSLFFLKFESLIRQ